MKSNLDRQRHEETRFSSVQFSRSVVSWTAAHQASLSITNSLILLPLMSIESVMPSNHLIFCPLLLPSIFPSIRVFSNESVLHIRWPKYWSFSFTISPFKNGSINGQEMPVWWENHFQSGFISELRDGNHLLFMPMKQQIIE